MEPTPTPELFDAPPMGQEVAAQAASQRAALANTITPSGAPAEASSLLGNVAPAIMGTLAATGAGIITLLGIKTMITGKPPWKQKETLT